MSTPNFDLTTDGSDWRQPYRVEYPAHDRPGFQTGGLKGAVSETSETGVRAFFPARLPADASVLTGDRMVGVINFSGGESAEIEGVVERFDGKTLELRLDTLPLPFGRIIRKQWWLRARAPWRDGK